MHIIAVTACTIGVAHTYIAQDKLTMAAQKRGHTIKVETQGNVGAENVLSAADIAAADVVILAADINVSAQERFKGKPIVRVSASIAIKQPEKLIEKIEQKMKGETACVQNH